jgi:hypothetical protein
MSSSNIYALPSSYGSYNPPGYSSIFGGTDNAPGNPVGDKNYWNTMGGRIGNALWPQL